MKNKFYLAMSLAVVLAMLLTSMALASDVAVAVIDVTAPTGSVTLQPGQSGPIVINLTVTGNQDGTATFQVYRDWTLSGGVFTGSNAQTFTVPAGSYTGGTKWTASTNGTVTIAAGETTETRTLAVSAFNITNSNSSGAKLSDGADSNYQVSVSAPLNTAPTLNLPGNLTAEATSASGAVVNYTASASDAEDNPDPTPTCSPASGSTFPLGTTTVNCSVTDSGGKSASSSFTVTVEDTTAPVIASHVDVTAEATSGAGAVVSYTSPATSDAVDGTGTATCTPASGGTFALGETTITCNATDVAGNAAAATTFKVIVADTTPPTISGTPSNITAEATSAAGAAVSYTSPAASDFVDGTVAVSCLPASDSTFPLGETTVTCTATDAHNNSAQTSFKVKVQDTTAPKITFVSRSPAANSNGWNNSDVTVTWSCTDLVGVDSATVSKTVSTEGSNQSATGTCKDTSGNTSSDTQTGINIDKTLPIASASASPVPNGNGWNNTNVTVSFNGSDGTGSGIDFCDADLLLSSEGSGQSASGTCTDKAGNISAPASITVNIDKSAPYLSLVGGPVDGGTYYFGFVPAAPTCSASDALSGLDGSCSVSGYSAAVGSHTVSASAKDKAGNSASASAAYTVSAWTLKGFYQPVDMTPAGNPPVWNTVKNGSTVPLKFEIFAGTTELSDTSAVKSLTSASVACSAGTEDAIEEVAAATGGTALRYDTTAGQFVYNWKTPGTANKCYRVTLTTNDLSTIIAYFKLK